MKSRIPSLGAALFALSLCLYSPEARSEQTIDYYIYDLILVVDHDRVGSDQQVFDAYGMALHLANMGIVVDWWIARDKAYEGVDFGTDTDDAPDPLTAGADGTVEYREYRAGPFVIRDPNRTTGDYNEAWDAINELRARFGFDPLIHEIRSDPSTDRLNLGFLTFMPRISYSNNAGIADDEIVLAQIPGVHVLSPGAIDESGTVAGGAMFTGSDADPCGRKVKYDVFIQDHADYGGDDPDTVRAAAELDTFLRRGTTNIFECNSATIEEHVRWLTVPPNPLAEGTASSENYSLVADFADHPFAQTMGNVPIKNGAFQLWDHVDNNFRDTAEHIFYDAVSGDYGYMLGQVDGGKFFFAGGHKREVVEDRRIILNAILYEVVSPSFRHGFWPALFREDILERKFVEIGIKGGATALNTVILDALEPEVTFVPDSVVIHVPGGSWSFDDPTNTLTFTIGTVDPQDYPDRIIAYYEIETLYADPGKVQILSSEYSYDDPWTTGINFTGSACQDISVVKELHVEKSADVSYLPVGTSELGLTITVSNNGSTVLSNVILKDTLPAGVAFVDGSIETFGRGLADWGETEVDTLTWLVGALLPGESHSIEFSVSADVAGGTEFLLNDGPRATARTSDARDLDSTGENLVLPVSPDEDHAFFMLTPELVYVAETNVFTFTVLNDGADKIKLKRGEAIELYIPAGWSEPTDVVVPAGWEWFWNSEARTLTLMHPGGDVTIDRGDSISFDFKLTSPPLPELSVFHGSGMFEANGGKAVFENDIFVEVVTTTDPDRDGDGISNDDELIAGSDPDNWDTDGDGIPDGLEVGPDPYNPEDTDDDGIFDYNDLDSDGDTIPDSVELIGDPDRDGIPNFRDDDSDNDGLLDRDEIIMGTDPYDPDTDGDGLWDGDEVDLGTDPLNPDSDCDGIEDGQEVEDGTDPMGDPGCDDADADAGELVDEPDMIEEDMIEDLSDIDLDDAADALEDFSDDDLLADAADDVAGDGTGDVPGPDAADDAPAGDIPEDMIDDELGADAPVDSAADVPAETADGEDVPADILAEADDGGDVPADGSSDISTDTSSDSSSSDADEDDGGDGDGGDSDPGCGCDIVT
ncbi:MAG: hypothetical protein ABIJ56_18360 [Pseudomonadota bacterium]